jgi:hypothetical protein
MLVSPVRPPQPRTPTARARAAAPDPADAELEARQHAFDRMLRERAELERETNAISDLGALQAKRDDELMRAWMKLI